jgi:hypothetical protein
MRRQHQESFAHEVMRQRRRKEKCGALHDGASTMLSNDIEFNGLGECSSYIGCVRISANLGIWRTPMTKIKTISAAVLLSVAVAAPAFAATHHIKNFRGAYDQVTTDQSFAVPSSQAERNIENFGFSGRDPSRVGGWDPSLNPSGS